MESRSRKKSVELIAKLGLLLFMSLFMLGVCELAVRGFVSVRNVGPSFTMYSPVYGVRLRPSISVMRYTPEFDMRFSTSTQGFRQPDEVPPGSRPVLFLGDSFTMGYGVDDGSEFAAVIRNQQPRERGPFLNAGLGDNGNGRWLKFLALEAPQYAPRLVVLQVMDNDFYDNLAEGLYVLRGGELVEQPVPPPGPRQWMQTTINALPPLGYSHLVGLLRQVRLPSRSNVAGDDGGSSEPSVPIESDESDELTYALIDRAISLCEGQGWPVLGLSVGIEGDRLERMKKVFGKHRATLLEAPSKAAHPELYYQIDGHWNAMGHARVAEMIADEIAR
jgi:hypothetical protein